MKTMDEVKAHMAEEAKQSDLEVWPLYEDTRQLDDVSLKVGRADGYLDALRWVLGQDAPAPVAPASVPAVNPFGKPVEEWTEAELAEDERTCQGVPARVHYNRYMARKVIPGGAFLSTPVQDEAALAEFRGKRATVKTDAPADAPVGVEEDGDDELTRRVEVKRYGSEGWIPIDPRECLHGADGSCVSSSGNSICGGYNGEENEGGKDWVNCGEDATPARPDGEGRF